MGREPEEVLSMHTGCTTVYNEPPGMILDLKLIDPVQRLRGQNPPVSIKQLSKRLTIGYATAQNYVKEREDTDVLA